MKIKLKKQQNGYWIVSIGNRKALISQSILAMQLDLVPSFKACVEALESTSTPKSKYYEWNLCTLEVLK